MAHAKSAIKRNRTNELRRQRNAHVQSRMKTYIKAVEAAIQAKDFDGVKSALPTALREIDKAASKGVIHPNNAARKKSTLQRQAHGLG